MERGEALLVSRVRTDALILDQERDHGKMALERRFVEGGLEDTGREPTQRVNRVLERWGRQPQSY